MWQLIVIGSENFQHLHHFVLRGLVVIALLKVKLLDDLFFHKYSGVLSEIIYQSLWKDLYIFWIALNKSNTAFLYQVLTTVEKTTFL
jgi:hypothetical protein